MDLHGQFEDEDIFQVSNVSLCAGAYIGFNADKHELGFGTKKFHVNDNYHNIQGIYVENTFKNTEYEGQWLNGNMTGLGRVTFYNSEFSKILGKYEGRLKNNNFDRKGKYISTDGRMYSGTYKDHRKWTGEVTKAKDTTRDCSEKYKDGDKEEC